MMLLVSGVVVVTTVLVSKSITKVPVPVRAIAPRFKVNPASAPLFVAMEMNVWPLLMVVPLAADWMTGVAALAKSDRVPPPKVSPLPPSLLAVLAE